MSSHIQPGRLLCPDIGYRSRIGRFESDHSPCYLRSLYCHTHGQTDWFAYSIRNKSRTRNVWIVKQEWQLSLLSRSVRSILFIFNSPSFKKVISMNLFQLPVGRSSFQRHRSIISLTMVDHFIRRNALWPTQFWWLLWRSFLDSYRNPSVHALRILQKIVILAKLNYMIKD